MQSYLFAAKAASMAYLEKADVMKNPLIEGAEESLMIYATKARAYSWVKDKTFFLTFRGTQTQSDMFADIKVLRTYLFPEGDKSVLVHSGFLSYFKSLDEQIMVDLDYHLPFIDTIHVMGHSLGGAIATIAAGIYGMRFPGKRILCHTVGSPRVGNLGFVKWFQKNVHESMRITNDEDPVTRFPISPLYTHVTGFICINDKCVVTEATVDTHWFWRLFYLPFEIDYRAPILDHSCTLYIQRLEQICAK